MGKIQKMIDYAVAVAKDDRHGYSQVRRWPKQGTDFDCATLMYESAHKAGYDVGEGPDKTRYTGTMLADFKKAGFTAVPFDGNLSDLTPGDILLNVVHHTEMYIGNGKFVGAHIAETGDTDGKPGDQTGNEISVCKAYIPDFGWDYVLVPPKETTAAKPTSTSNATAKKLYGIDVSSNQPANIVNLVPNDFAIVKMSGNPQGYDWDYVNPYAKQQAADAMRKHGRLGLYHFTWGKSANTEADFFVEQVRNLGYIGKAVLVIDYEAQAVELGRNWVKRFADRILDRTGVKPVIYASGSVIVAQNLMALGYPIWCANYARGYDRIDGYSTSGCKIYGGCEKSVLWQYTSQGYLKGYDAPLDCNVFFGTSSDWMKLAAKSSGTKPKPATDAVTQPRYRVWRDGKWQAWHSNGTSAGKAGSAVYDVDFSGLPSGSWWRLTLKGGKVLAKNEHNDAHKTPIAGIEVYYKTKSPESTGYYEALYRVYAGGKWLKWEHDVEDGGAGDDRNQVEKIQFKVAKC